MFKYIIILAITLLNIFCNIDSSYAKQYLSIKRAKTSIKDYASKQNGTTKECKRINNIKINCKIEIPLKVSSGSAVNIATIQAWLLKDNEIYLHRIGQWSLVIKI
jgi:hypothetical protein